MESDLLKKFCIVWASGGGRRGGAPPFNGPLSMGRVWHSDRVGASVADCFYAVVGAFGWTWISVFLIQRQTAIPIVGRSFLLLRGIRLCIFVPGKTLFLT